jgi:hypothetical protein
MSEQPGQQPTEEELRAALEEELRRLTVDDVLLQTVVTLINLAGRKAGLAPGSEGERDLEQVRSAIEGARALLPVLEPRHGSQLGPIRDALSQLQLAYAREAGAPGAAEGAKEPTGTPPGGGEQPPPDGPEGPGPAQSSGRLWVPGR